MDAPGIVRIEPDQTELIERVGAFMGESFLEELWTATYLEALDRDEGGVRAFARALLRAEFAEAARFGCAYALPDEAAAALGFLGSELSAQNATWEEIEATAHETLAEALTPDEAAALAAQAKAMEPISLFGWGGDEAAAMGFDDYIYFAAWAVDAGKRGSGAFRRLTTPFFDFADERGVPCFLECYADNLISLYEHVGFETFRVLEAPGFAIKQTCMVRRPQLP